MLSFFENPWVVGIGTGIISSIIVFLITNMIHRYKNNLKHREQINSANRDIIHTLKQYVVEKGLPEKEIVNTIIISTARKYNVKSEELYTISVICEELIREIVENVYVSSDKKSEYSLQLKDYLNKLSEEQPDAKQANPCLTSDVEEELMQDNKLAVIMSAFMGIVAGIVTGMLSFVSTHTNSAVSEILMQTMQISITIPVIPCAVVLASFFAVIYFARFLKKFSKNKMEESNIKSPDNE